LLAKPTSRNVNLDSDRFAMFNKERDIPRDVLPADRMSPTVIGSGVIGSGVIGGAVIRAAVIGTAGISIEAT
jgi:hypothetical protein